MEINIKTPLFCNCTGKRENNEDSIYPRPAMADSGSRLFMVCDGMGGHKKGEVASLTVSQAVADYWLLNQQEKDTLQKVNNAIDFAISRLNDIDDTQDLPKMGTTLALASIGRESVLIAHIGDSRIYHIRPGKGIIRQTKDHSLVQTWVEAGLLTPEEAAAHPKKNVITRAVQPRPEEPVTADAAILTDIHDGDYLFLCSDGVTESLSPQNLAEIITLNTADPNKIETIVKICSENSKDNFSAYLIPLSVTREPGDIPSDDIISYSDRQAIARRQQISEIEDYINETKYKRPEKPSAQSGIAPGATPAPDEARSPKKHSPCRTGNTCIPPPLPGGMQPRGSFRRTDYPDSRCNAVPRPAFIKHIKSLYRKIISTINRTK